MLVNCKTCGKEIGKGVKKCVHCGADQRNFFSKHKIITGIVALVIIGGIGSAMGSGGKSNTTQTPVSLMTATPVVAPAPKPVPVRQVAGVATDLGAGSFLGGKDVPVGLYDVTPSDGSGNFTVKSSGENLKINEVLGDAASLGVSKVRVNVSDGDAISLEGINKTHFEPVTIPFVTKVQAVSMYSGSWVVGEDVAAGRYVAAPTSGSGNFVVNATNGTAVVNEILGGDMGVKNVTINLTDGQTINVGGINQVDLTPAK